MKSTHTRNHHGEPVWTITLTGWHEITRFAANLLYQQVEFARIGSKALRWQRRAMGAARFERYLDPFYPINDPRGIRRTITRASKRVAS